MLRSVIIYAIVLTTLLCVPTTIVSFQSEPDNMENEPVTNFNDNCNSNTESLIIPDDNSQAASRSTYSRSNFKIESNIALSMPKINESWIQERWNGGGGQDIWEDPSKYKSSSNLVTTELQGDLILEKGGYIEGWLEMGDAPVQRFNHKMVWSPSYQAFFIYGGFNETNSLQHTLYKYEPAQDKWTHLSKSFHPGGRGAHIMVWDSVSDRLWIYAGHQHTMHNYLNNLWVYEPTTDKWTQKAYGPSGRCYSAGVFDPVNNQIIVYGGYKGSYFNPSADVHIYSIDNDEWTIKPQYVGRFYHDAVWCPKTNSMFVYGGIEKIDQGVADSGDFLEYFPNNNTWVEHTGIGVRVRPVLAWDSYNEKIIVHGGLDQSFTNETWYYDVISKSWEQKMDGPIIKDYSAGAFDALNKQFVTYGGQNSLGMDKYWAFAPNIPGYKKSGELVSSVFEFQHNVNPTKLSFNVTNLPPSGYGKEAVKFRIAGSKESAEDADLFIGPAGTTISYFANSSGEIVPEKLKGSRYLAYDVNITTPSQLLSPIVEKIKIDYYYYPSEYSYKSPVYDLEAELGRPLRYVSWAANEPAGTLVEVFIRQAADEGYIEQQAWEAIENGQQEFGYKSGRSFQYKIHMETSKQSITPVLENIEFTFNEPPSQPILTSPENESWLADSTPVFSWEFCDPDAGDYQTAFKINIDVFESYPVNPIMPVEVNSLNSSYSPDEDLGDGTYYCVVRTCDNYGSWSDWSKPLIFNIDASKPTTPEIECFTHPLEKLWYANNQPRFDWLEPSDTTGIVGYSFLLDQNPTSEPPETVMLTADDYWMKRNLASFNGFLFQEDVLEDGIWYLHLKARDDLGTWSESARREVRIDTRGVQVEDLTPTSVNSGEPIRFRFELNETGSGIDSAALSWRCDFEVDFQYDVLNTDNEGYIYLNQTIEKNTASYVEYYLEVTDRSNPVNFIRYPQAGLKQVNIVDTEPPEIQEVTGSITQTPYSNLVIVVDAVDNTGISEAKIYLLEPNSALELMPNPDGTYSIEIDRSEIPEMLSHSDDNTISYFVTVWDHNGNSARAPQSGFYKITIQDIDDTEEPQSTDGSEKEAESFETIPNIILMTAIVIVVLLVLFIFMRKQKKALELDRQKLQTAVAEVQEKAAKIDTVPSKALNQSPIIDITASIKPASQPKQNISPKNAPAGLLSPAGASITRGRAEDSPETTPEAAEASDIKLGESESTNVVLDSGCFISMPESGSSSKEDEKSDEQKDDPTKDLPEVKLDEGEIMHSGETKFWKPKSD
ncbi:MAG: hypothetical protein JSV49_07975 [Thermoplasmata archaeon]|nr:MAG: hypothetical protein JSV49_07975 [Thermoplasmata archaeon]